MTVIMNFICTGRIHCMTFRRQLYAVFSLSCIVFFSIAYLTSVISRNEIVRNSNFAKLPHRDGRRIQRLLSPNKAKKLKYLSISELDRITIKKNINVLVPKKLPQCSYVTFQPPHPEELQETFQWQMIDYESVDSYVFSAFYDQRTNPPMVRIIGITKETVLKKFCQLWFDVTSTPEIVEAELVLLPETHGKKYIAVFYVCYIPQQKLQIPYAVSVVKSPCQTSSNILKVLNNGHQSKVNFTVCVSPVNRHFNEIFQFIEILELNRLFGAERFVFYNHSIGAKVDKCLENYALEGIVSIIPWKIPVIVEGDWPPNQRLMPEIHYFGQVAAANDCLYRNMFHSRFVVFTDLDEVIVPRFHETWLAMLGSATNDWLQDFFTESTKTMFPGSYNIRNVFFRLDWEDVSRKLDLPVLSLQKLYREEMIYPWYVRSKHIVWSKMTTKVSIHSAFEFIDDSKISTVRVSEKHALLHHYRVWDGEENITSVARIMDNRTLHFATQLISRIQMIHQKILL